MNYFPIGCVLLEIDRENVHISILLASTVAEFDQRVVGNRQHSSIRKLQTARYAHGAGLQSILKEVR